MTDASTIQTDMISSFVEVMDDTVTGTEPYLSMTVTPRHSTIGSNVAMSTTQVCVTVKAGDLPDDSKRAPVDLIVALDCSGSMQGPKLDLCKTTLERVVRVLQPSDRFGLITFASEVLIDIPAQKMDTKNKKEAIAKIKSLRTRGGTNISDAIGIAAQEMKLVRDPNEVRTIFLLTDGLANEGITDPAGLLQLATNCLGNNDLPIEHRASTPSTPPTGSSLIGGMFRRRSEPPVPATEAPTKVDSSDVPKVISTRSPITLHCFGYGNDHDSNLLTKLASGATPGGTYCYVENDNNVGAAFGNALGGVLSVVAQSTVVHISIPPEAMARGVAIKDVFYDHKVKREDGSYSVMLGDFYAEESRDVLFEITLASVVEAETVPVPHASVSLSYTDTLQKQPVMLGPVTCAILRPTGSELSEEDQHVLIQWLRIFSTNQMAEADNLGRRGDRASAISLIQGALASVQSAPGGVQSDPVVVQLAKDLQEAHVRLESEDQYEQCSHFLHSAAHQHTRQRFARSSALSGDGSNLYQGKLQMRMASAFHTK